MKETSPVASSDMAQNGTHKNEVLKGSHLLKTLFEKPFMKGNPCLKETLFDMAPVLLLFPPSRWLQRLVRCSWLVGRPTESHRPGPAKDPCFDGKRPYLNYG